MSFTDTSAVSSKFITSLWGLNTPPPTVTDSQLANLLAPYLGTLPPYAKDANGNITGAPFTTNMTVANFDLVQQFLTHIQNSNSSASTLQTDISNILAAAQSPQVPVFGQPAPLPPGSGGLARNTASALGAVIASLQTAGILLAISGNSITVNAGSFPANFAAWLAVPANQTLIKDAITQLNQDVPIATAVVNVNGVDQEIRVPLNQSLQEVIQTQYVQQGANLVYAGLQALVDQQQGAEDSIRTLNQLQQVYNGIQVLPTSGTIISSFAGPTTDTNGIAYTIGNHLANALKNGGIEVTDSNGNSLGSISAASLGLGTVSPANPTPIKNFIIQDSNGNNEHIVGTDYDETYNSGVDGLLVKFSADSKTIDLTFTTGGNSTSFTMGLTDPISISTPTVYYSNIGFESSAHAFVGATTGTDLSEGLLQAIRSNPLSFNTITANAFLSGINSDPQTYLNALPAIIKNLFSISTTFPASSVQINGAALSLGAGGNMQQLINSIYQDYLSRAAQRLTEADSNLIIDPSMTVDPATGRVGLIVNPAVTGAAALTSANNLQVIRSLLSYGLTLNTGPGTGSVNIGNPLNVTNPSLKSGSLIPLIATAPVSGPNGTLTGDVATGTGSGQFGAPQGGSLEANLATILGNLIGGGFFLGGDSNVTGKVTWNQSGDLDITQWILGVWPSSLGTAAPSSLALDQTQSYLSNAFSSASSLNDSLQQQLQQSFFLFQEFMQSATDTLSAINQLITKKAQAIAG